MQEAVTFSSRVQEDMAQIFVEWKTARNDPASEDFVGILTEDVNELTDHMAEAARNIQKTLTKIANDYDDVIVDMENIIAKAQTTFANRVQNQERLLKEIREAEAQKAQVASMVDDLKQDIDVLERRAAKHEKLAQSADPIEETGHAEGRQGRVGTRHGRRQHL